MATGQPGFDGVTFDLVSVQYHALKAGHDYGQYVRDAENAGRDEIAQLFRDVMQQDTERAHGATSSLPSWRHGRHEPPVTAGGFPRLVVMTGADSSIGQGHGRATRR